MTLRSCTLLDDKIAFRHRASRLARIVEASHDPGMSVAPIPLDGVKRSIHQAFEAALDEIESFGRRPSRWEEDCLTRALAAMACGAYALAAFEIRYFQAYVERKIDSRRELSRPLREVSLNLNEMREGLANIRARH